MQFLLLFFLSPLFPHLLSLPAYYSYNYRPTYHEKLSIEPIKIAGLITNRDNSEEEGRRFGEGKGFESEEGGFTERRSGGGGGGEGRGGRGGIVVGGVGGGGSGIGEKGGGGKGGGGKVEDGDLRILSNKEIFMKVFRESGIVNDNRIFDFLEGEGKEWDWKMDYVRNEFELPEKVKKESNFVKWKRIMAILKTMKLEKDDNKKFLPKIVNPPVINFQHK